MSKRERLRTTFEQVAEQYDRARPTYPERLFDDLAALLPRGARVVEIGPGTGQATAALAGRGFAVVGVELGPRLAALARRNLLRFPNVEIVVEDFERWEPGQAGFDAVTAFTMFHWLDPAVKYEQAARLLRPGAVLAVVEVTHVLLEDGDPFWAEVQEDYDAVLPSPENRPPPFAGEVGDLREELAASGLFDVLAPRRYLWDVVYTADEWVDVMGTYSPHIAGDPAATERLFERIRARIEARSDPRVTKHYLATLSLGRRR